MTSRKAMGKRIQGRREAAGLTQTELAQAMGIDQATVSRWEAGKVPIDTDDLDKLAKVLQARGGWIVDASGPAPGPYIRKESLVAHDRLSERGPKAKRRPA